MSHHAQLLLLQTLQIYVCRAELMALYATLSARWTYDE